MSEDGIIKIVTTPKKFLDLITMAAMTKDAKGSEANFHKIVLNFEEDRVWFASKTEGAYFRNFGYLTTNPSYYKEISGIGKVGLTTKKMIDYVTIFRNYKEITFIADTNKKIFSIEVDGDKTTSFLDNWGEIMTASTTFPIKLSGDFVPLMKDNEYKYGITLNNEELKTILSRRETFLTKNIPFVLSRNGIDVVFNNIDNPVDVGANRKRLVASSGTPRLPETDEELEFIIGTKIESPATRYTGEIDMYFSDSPGIPICVTKKDEGDNGSLLFTGSIIGTKVRI